MVNMISGMGAVEMTGSSVALVLLTPLLVSALLVASCCVVHVARERHVLNPEARAQKLKLPERRAHVTDVVSRQMARFAHEVEHEVAQLEHELEHFAHHPHAPHSHQTSAAADTASSSSADKQPDAAVSDV